MNYKKLSLAFKRIQFLSKTRKSHGFPMIIHRLHLVSRANLQQMLPIEVHLLHHADQKWIHKMLPGHQRTKKFRKSPHNIWVIASLVLIKLIQFTNRPRKNSNFSTILTLHTFRLIREMAIQREWQNLYLSNAIIPKNRTVISLWCLCMWISNKWRLWKTTLGEDSIKAAV